jgi:tetratricopeptide (TPR) repeat protein
VSDLLAGLLAALISTNAPTAVSNLVQQKTGIAIEIANPNDPVTQEYLKLVADDDTAVEEIEKWSDDAKRLPGGAGEAARTTLNLRIHTRLDGVKKNYQDFIERHPDFVRARLAFGSFLYQIEDTEGAQVQWEKARDLDPKNSAAWDNLGKLYANGNVKKSFECYAKAIELNPSQSVYYYNLAECMYEARTAATEYWGISEQQVFDVALQLYQKAIKLDPDNFLLASDYAESFYGISPPRWKEGLEAWKQCLKIAHDEDEREGVLLHLARIELRLTNFDESRRNLGAVTNPGYAVLKGRLSRNLDQAIQNALTNGPPQLLR